MDVQLTLDQMKRPLPDLTEGEWLAIYKVADNSRSNHLGGRYYDDDEGFCSVVQWRPGTLPVREGREFMLYGCRRTTPNAFGRRETVEQWFARLEADAQHRDSSYVGCWLLRLDQLAQLAGREPAVRS
jgi:hypothetical protein